MIAFAAFVVEADNTAIIGGALQGIYVEIFYQNKSYKYIYYYFYTLIEE
ncbi:hypothetical protein ABVB72_12105 [Rhizobium nepotum]